MTIVDELTKVEVFQGLSAKQIEKIAEVTEEKQYMKGETVHVESGTADYLYVLLKGEIILKVSLSSHNQSITVGIINRANQCFGWSGLIAPNYYTATASSEEDSLILAINGQKLLEILKKEPQAGFVVMQAIAGIISSRLRNCRSALLKTI